MRYLTIILALILTATPCLASDTTEPPKRENPDGPVGAIGFTPFLGFASTGDISTDLGTVDNDVTSTQVGLGLVVPASSWVTFRASASTTKNQDNTTSFDVSNKTWAMSLSLTFWVLPKK